MNVFRVGERLTVPVWCMEGGQPSEFTGDLADVYGTIIDVDNEIIVESELTPWDVEISVQDVATDGVSGLFQSGTEVGVRLRNRHYYATGQRVEITVSDISGTEDVTGRGWPIRVIDQTSFVLVGSLWANNSGASVDDTTKVRRMGLKKFTVRLDTETVGEQYRLIVWHGSASHVQYVGMSFEMGA